MPTLAQMFRDAAGKEPIAAAVIAADPDWIPDGERKRGKSPTRKWPEVEQQLEAFYVSAGSSINPDIPAVYAWTPTRVLFVDEYDGFFSVNSVPRRPGKCVPQYSGNAH